MKILFLVHDTLTMPLGIGYLSSIVRQAGYDIEIASLTEPDPVSIAIKFSPDLIAFGSTTGFHRKYLELNKKIRNAVQDVKSVMGGAHPTFFPDVIEKDTDLDYIIRGEGEISFLQLLEAMENKRDFSSVGNLSYRFEDRIKTNPMIPLIKDLDSIPFPDRQLIRRFGKKINTKAVFVITGRGCPYDCSYCFNHSYRKLYSGLGPPLRRRSVRNVIDELLLLREEYPDLQMIIFQDDVFILQHDWVFEFCRVYRKEIGLPFHCHLRADLVSREIMTALADAGCVSVKMAIETANDRIRNEILNRNLSTGTIIEACDEVKKAGIVLVTQNILALPTGSLKDDLDTLRMNFRCRPDFAFATLLQPYPGTRIGDLCRNMGIIENTSDGSLPDSFFDRSTLIIPDRDQIERLRKLFALSIEFSFLRGFLKTLIRLPLNRLYELLDKLWKGYCIKQREFPYKLTIREYARNVLSYFRSRYY